MTTTFQRTSDVNWPAPEPVAAERVVGGSPETQSLSLLRSSGVDAGLWRVTPGAFTTVHDGYAEYVQIMEGQGDLVHDDGTVTPLSPGSVVLMEPGWRGRWVIRETLVKAYTTVPSSTA